MLVNRAHKHKLVMSIEHHTPDIQACHLLGNKPFDTFDTFLILKF